MAPHEQNPVQMDDLVRFGSIKRLLAHPADQFSHSGVAISRMALRDVPRLIILPDPSSIMSANKAKSRHVIAVTRRDQSDGA